MALMKAKSLDTALFDRVIQMGNLFKLDNLEVYFICGCLGFIRAQSDVYSDFKNHAAIYLKYPLTNDLISQNQRRIFNYKSSS